MHAILPTSGLIGKRCVRGQFFQVYNIFTDIERFPCIFWFAVIPAKAGVTILLITLGCYSEFF